MSLGQFSRRTQRVRNLVANYQTLGSVREGKYREGKWARVLSDNLLRISKNIQHPAALYIYDPGPRSRSPPPTPPPMVWSPTRCTPDLTFTRCLQTQPAIACYLLRLGDVKPCLWAIRKHLGSPIPYLQAFRSIYALLPLLRTHTSTRLLPPPFLPCQRATYVEPWPSTWMTQYTHMW